MGFELSHISSKSPPALSSGSLVNFPSNIHDQLHLPDVPSQTRPKRTTKPPAWLHDYITDPHANVG